MNLRFARYAAWFFAVAAIAALAVLALGPVPFIRGLGAGAFACAALGGLVNALVLRIAGREAYWHVGAPANVPAGRPRERVGYSTPDLRTRLLPARLLTHA